MVTAVRALGGRAKLREIYRWIEHHRSKLPDEYQAVVRATIYAHSTDARAYIQGNINVFYKVARGEWGLRFPNETIPGRSYEALQKFVLSRMTREELESYAGRGQEFMAELDRRVEQARQKYHMAT